MRERTAFRPVGRSIVLTAILAVLAAACHPVSSTAEHPTTGPASPTTPPPTTPPTISPPADPAAAAAELARDTTDPALDAQAVADILTRSGIPIVSPADGLMVNHPSPPVLADAYVYDFEVPLLAQAMRSDRTWFLEDVFDLPDRVLDVAGRPTLDFGRMSAALSQWARAAFAEPSAPGAFLPMAVRQLSLVHRTPQDIFSNVDPGGFGIDPLQFVLLSASMMSGAAEYLPGETPAPGSGCAVPVPSPLPTPPPGFDAILLSRALGPDGTAIRSELQDNNLEEPAGDLIATLALLGGVDISVTDTANGRYRAPSLHSGQPRRFQFTAMIALRSAEAGQTIACDGLAGVPLPKAGPIAGWTVSWVLVQSPTFVVPAGQGEAHKLLTETDPSKAPDEGTTDRGQVTGPEGHSTLAVHVVPRPANGLDRTGTVTALVVVDPFRTDGRVAVPELLPRFESDTDPVRALALRWRDAAVAEIGLPVAVDSVIVTR